MTTTTFLGFAAACTGTAGSEESITVFCAAFLAPTTTLAR